MDKELYTKLIELIDGAKVCVELWEADHNAQKIWKNNWLKEARQEIYDYQLKDIKYSIKRKLTEQEIEFLKGCGVDLDE